jgi:hypothetical protein
MSMTENVTYYTRNSQTGEVEEVHLSEKYKHLPQKYLNMLLIIAFVLIAMALALALYGLRNYNKEVSAAEAVQTKVIKK